MNGLEKAICTTTGFFRLPSEKPAGGWDAWLDNQILDICGEKPVDVCVAFIWTGGTQWYSSSSSKPLGIRMRTRTSQYVTRACFFKNGQVKVKALQKKYGQLKEIHCQYKAIKDAENQKIKHAMEESKRVRVRLGITDSYCSSESGPLARTGDPSKFSWRLHDMTEEQITQIAKIVGYKVDGQD